MLLKSFPFVIFCGLAAGWPRAYGQATDNRAYSDPDEMRPLVRTSVTRAAHQALSSSEQAVLCRKGRGFISFRCQVDGSGRIEAITAVQLYQAAKQVPAPMLAKLQERVRRDVLFHVPAVDRPPNMGKWRRSSVIIPLAVFCK
ncbi:MAG TPA: hypothetical protein VF629_24915 [Hymenobacter sp.]|jgi:hypothetical protein|uniref:hypothetical protein n=1 Tax=Hymenobacter sp. TaxID=1898978 RepID=UPI002ED8AA4B